MFSGYKLHCNLCAGARNNRVQRLLFRAWAERYPGYPAVLSGEAGTGNPFGEDDKFRFCIPVADTGHIPAASFRTDPVCHTLKSAFLQLGQIGQYSVDLLKFAVSAQRTCLVHVGLQQKVDEHFEHRYIRPGSIESPENSCTVGSVQ